MTKYTIYGTDSCPFCTRAKTLLELTGLEYDYVDAKNTEQAQTLFSENNWRTVPQIFHGEKHIGGFTELNQYLKNQKVG